MKKISIQYLTTFLLLPATATGTGLPTGNLGNLTSILIVFFILILGAFIAINYNFYLKFISHLNDDNFRKAKVLGIVLSLFNTVFFFLPSGFYGFIWAALFTYFLYRKYRKALQRSFDEEEFK